MFERQPTRLPTIGGEILSRPTLAFPDGNSQTESLNGICRRPARASRHVRFVAAIA